MLASFCGMQMNVNAVANVEVAVEVDFTLPYQTWAAQPQYAPLGALDQRLEVGKVKKFGAIEVDLGARGE